MKLIVKNIVTIRRVLRSWVTKDKKGLPSTVILIPEFGVLLRRIFVCVYYQIEDFGW